jgi:hypothetical protein
LIWLGGEDGLSKSEGVLLHLFRDEVWVLCSGVGNGALGFGAFEVSEAFWVF